MMRIRCPYCSWMIILKPDQMAAGIAQAEALKSAHHVEHCPKCRRAIKVSLKQMKRQLPPGFQIPRPQPAAAEKPASEESEATSEAAETSEEG